MTVDLGKVRAALARIERVLREHPEIRERTAALFATDPTVADLDRLKEAKMTKKEPLSIKLDPAMMDRADALVQPLAADPVWGAVLRASRATVLRLALVEGLAVLERRYGVAGPGSMVPDTEQETEQD